MPVGWSRLAILCCVQLYLAGVIRASAVLTDLSTVPWTVSTKGLELESASLPTYALQELQDRKFIADPLFRCCAGAHPSRLGAGGRGHHGRGSRERPAGC